ncbi:hypothetical protein MPOCJGCO_1899 [Methylobacterium trifolii]|uniref:Uncharacterized protein n=1 Tax=Methylobacterium trifolii TaxID=1003092 RepID=A0ABQ4U0E4_9HYPH|nr:hypothetical protein MPOCJGCO_1899 [Methylobacterium trifolii]
MNVSKTEISLKIFRNDLSMCVGRASKSEISKLVSELKVLIYTLETFQEQPDRPRKIAR